jgi:hypothetical protein
VAGLGIGLSFLGYWVLYYGITQVQGGNWGFLDLGLPSRWDKTKDTPKDGGAPAATPSGPPPKAYNRPKKGPASKSPAGAFRPTPGR